MSDNWSLSDLEVEVARRMYFGLMPDSEAVDVVSNKYNLEIVPYCQPESQIGGDFWGTIELDDNNLAIYLADCSGR